MDSAGTSLNIHIARPGEIGFNVAAAGMRVKRGGDVLGADASTPSLHMRAASDVAHSNLARASLGLHFSADPLDSNAAGATVSLHCGIGGHGDFVADSDMPAHIQRQVVTDANAVPVLLNRGIRFDGVYRAFGAGEPFIVGVHGSVYHDLVRAAGLDGDVA